MSKIEGNVKPLFRENAIKHLNSIEEMQVSLKIIKPGEYTWLIISLLFLAGILTWGIFGQISMNVIASGILLSEEQLQLTEKNIEESLRDRKTKVLNLKKILDKKKDLYKKQYLSLIDLEKAEEEYILAKDDLMNISKSSYIPIENAVLTSEKTNINNDLDALVFVKYLDGKKILPGMQAYLLPSSLSAYEYGYIKGKVMSISNYPASKEVAYLYLGNMNLVDEFFSNGVPFVVKIKLEKNSKTKSGFSWTTNKGPLFKIETGSIVTTKIVNKTCSPLKLLTKTEC